MAGARTQRGALALGHGVWLAEGNGERRER
jgi:hypothetical protein